MAVEVRFDAAQSRWEATEDDRVIGVADVRVHGDRVLFTHTYVTPERRGQGIAERLVAAALDDVRARGAVAVPQCWYVAEFMQHRRDYRDLLTPRRSAEPAASIQDESSESSGAARSPAMQRADTANGERQDDAAD